MMTLRRISILFCIVGAAAYLFGLWKLHFQLQEWNFPVILGLSNVAAFALMGWMANRREDAFTLWGLTILSAAMMVAALLYGFDGITVQHSDPDSAYYPGKVMTSILVLFVQAFFMVLVPLYVVGIEWIGVVLGAIWVWLGNRRLAKSDE